MRLSVGTIVAAGTFPAAARTHDGLAAGAVAELRLTPYYILEGMGVAALCQRILRFFVIEVAARLFLASFKVFRPFKVFKVLNDLKGLRASSGAPDGGARRCAMTGEEAQRFFDFFFDEPVFPFEDLLFFEGILRF